VTCSYRWLEWRNSRWASGCCGRHWRLSALALLLIFIAAVYPFGSVDLIGHALIMAIILLIAADPEPEVHFLPAVRRRIAMVPAGVVFALALFATGYWGLHAVLYGPEGQPGAPRGELATHAEDPDNPHMPGSKPFFQSGQ
jgi:hypothetical protein